MEIFDNFSRLKSQKLNTKIELVAKSLNLNPDCEQNPFLKTTNVIYKIGHEKKDY